MHSSVGIPCGMGFPIGRFSHHGLVAGSVRLIAGSYVLHRLLTPRHPPSALVAWSCRPDPDGKFGFRSFIASAGLCEPGIHVPASTCRGVHGRPTKRGQPTFLRRSNSIVQNRSRFFCLVSLHLPSGTRDPWGITFARSFRQLPLNHDLSKSVA
jgi:hypothetical protein